MAAGLDAPEVSTLNAVDGVITSNMALVPTINGSVSAWASNPEPTGARYFRVFRAVNDLGASALLMMPTVASLMRH